jgi:hypothetical protein
MPAPDPIVESIAANVVSTLGSVVAGATYHYTITTAWADNEASTWGHLKALVAMDDATEREAPVNYREWDQPFIIVIGYQATESDSTPSRTPLARLWSDVYRVLMTDHTRGGYAIDTRIEPPMFFADTVVITATVQYRHKITDPTDQT